jgi:hypothetical protein
MKSCALSIPIGLGDLIYIRSAFDAVKHNFSQIRLSFDRNIIQSVDRSLEYNQFLDEIGALLFSESPYILENSNHPFHEHVRIYSDFGLPLRKPELAHVLCKGNSLKLKGEYIVLTTKLRYFPRDVFNSISAGLWLILKELSQKYTIVVLGERQVEMNREYQHHTDKHIYSIYEDIKSHVPADRLLDLTIPALGICSPKLSQVQQDCLIMKEAKFVITLGVGGNFCMATAVANTIGYRVDDEPIADAIFSKKYPNADIMKNWPQFVNKLRTYL